MARDLQGFTPEEIMRLDLGRTIARVGSSGHVFNLSTFRPPEPPEIDPTAKIIAFNRRACARPRPEVEAASDAGAASAATRGEVLPQPTGPGGYRGRPGGFRELSSY